MTTSSSAASTTHSIFVNASARFQTVTGFGAAFTDAAVLGFHALTPGAQANLLRSYWGEGGLQYSLGRVPIGGTDFSTSVYSYDDSIDDDLNLTRFSIDVDERSGKLPLVRAALARSKSSSSSSSSNGCSCGSSSSSSSTSEGRSSSSSRRRHSCRKASAPGQPGRSHTMSQSSVSSSLDWFIRRVHRAGGASLRVKVN